MKDYQSHPAAKLFPMLTPPELAKLSEDIKSNGLLNPIIVHNDLILDGRNRFLACKMAEVKPRFEEWKGNGSVTAWVLSINLHRRHLSASQKAAIAVESLPLLEEEAKERKKLLSGTRSNQGEVREKIPSPPPMPKGKSTEQAAASAGVNPRYVQDAKKLKEEAPEEFEKVLKGDKTINAAKKVFKPAPVRPAPEAKPQTLDKTGFVVPEHLIPAFERGDQEVKENLRSVSELRSHLKRVRESKDPQYAEVNFNGTEASLDNVYSDLKRAVPYAVCPSCSGYGDTGCTFCKGRGWLSKFLYDSCATVEQKTMREKLSKSK